MAQPAKQEGRFKRISGTIFVAGVAALILLTLFIGRVRVTLNDDGVTVAAPVFLTTTVAWDDISAVALLEDSEPGRREFGYKGFFVSAGDYTNSAFGAYRLFAYNRVPFLIDLTTGRGHVVFNASTEGETRALYEAISRQTGAGEAP